MRGFFLHIIAKSSDALAGLKPNAVHTVLRWHELLIFLLCVAPDISYLSESVAKSPLQFGLGRPVVLLEVGENLICIDEKTILFEELTAVAPK